MNDEHSVVDFASMNLIPIRLQPGQDLKLALEAWLDQECAEAGWVVSGIGSLSCAQLRWAGRADPTVVDGDLEIVTLQGSLCRDGAHLHATVADAQGCVLGGHLCVGSIVRTTAESWLRTCRSGSCSAWRIPPLGTESWRFKLDGSDLSVAEADNFIDSLASGSSSCQQNQSETERRWKR